MYTHYSSDKFSKRGILLLEKKTQTNLGATLYLIHTAFSTGHMGAKFQKQVLQDITFKQTRSH